MSPECIFKQVFPLDSWCNDLQLIHLKIINTLICFYLKIMHAQTNTFLS